MITFLTGVPGSGKTYKAVVSIYNNFSSSKNAKPDLKKDYENCYTNINELKYKDLNNTYPLDVDDLKEKLTILHKLYKDKVTDDILIEKCKDLNIYRSLFVIDEAHNIFDVNDKVLIWWLSYHRHLYHDIFLITQNLSLIFTKYKSFSEYFYKAKPTTVSLNRNTFKYDVYINSRMSMNAKSHTEKIAKNQEVFDLYHSGDSVKASNVLIKFYVFSIFAIFAFFIIGYYIFGGDDDKLQQSQKPIQTYSKPIIKNIVDEEPLYDFKDLVLLEFKCSNTLCTSKDLTLYKKVLFHYKTTQKEHIKEIYSYYPSFTIQVIFFEISKDFLNFLKGVTKDEKDINNLNTNFFKS
ncbi:hypothetical protein M947_06455 [Sulfurimonas hongkongensis]|uniref:Zona occludens toxin N-terminal domain-containing protein n=1 Tax=Sulfurimonas hongkongensis TaxID=1172190 RepID=T0JNC6_9BACT|nr:zonular occludens toxin domain-containing protein [Sulfurimonas hongkongensis]EQB39631.1 hypothetical protein M947_06455 [Sulfurimonas hongkongensis]